MKKALPLLGFLLLALAVIAPAQDYTGRARIFGFALDKEGRPIEGVKVKLFSLKVQQGFETATDKNGKWSALGIVGGAWNVDFEKAGYAPKKIAIQVEEWKRNPEFKVTLEKTEGMAVSDELKTELEKGNQLFDEKKYDEAAAIYKGILEKLPDIYLLNKNIGNCYFEQEKYDEAEAYYKKVLEKDPSNVEVTLAIGNCYSNRGQAEQALEWYNKIEFDKINDPIVLFNVGTVYYNSSKFEEALKYYQKSVEIQKDFLDGIYQLGLTQLTMGKYPEAIACFEDYLKLDPDSPRSAQVKSFIETLKKK